MGIRGITDLEPWREPLERACYFELQGLLSVESLQAGLDAGDYRAFEIDGRAVAVVEIAETRLGRSLVGLALAGEGLGDWGEEWASTARQIAQEQGCSTVLVWARPGGMRAYKALGFELKGVTMALEV